MRRAVLAMLCAACSSSPVEPDASMVDAPEIDVSMDSPVDTTLDAFDPTPWRSELYPEDWTPAHTIGALFLHDFSHAGYANGERTPNAEGALFDITDYGADPTNEDDTAAFQSAIDAASEVGGIVWIPEGTYRLAGVLRVTSPIVIRGEGSDRSRLRFTTLEGMASRAHVSLGNGITHGAEVLLSVDGESRSNVVRVEDASALAVGDDVDLGWVITPEFVDEHGMTGIWEVFNDQWQPFFRRTIIAIDGDEITLDVPLRYRAETRDSASLRISRGWIREVGIESIGFSNAGPLDDAWSESQVHLLEMVGLADAWIDDVATFGEDAHVASGGILIRASKRVTVSNTSIGPAQNRGPGGNGYLFEVRTSSEILYRDCVARGGRHNFITNWGFGTSGIVWLRVHSRDGEALSERDGFRTVGASDFHHSLAMASLIDSSVVDDGWSARNRLTSSSGAGHGATECAFWNTTGGGTIHSYQWGYGYVIGTSRALTVSTELPLLDETPIDWTEGLGRAVTLSPSSLYEDQLARRL